jgi:RNA polymerase sigma-70 factor (ECF subfamily)
MRAIAGRSCVRRRPPARPAALGDHVDRLYRAAWALCGSREDAEDLVQETFAKVLAKPRFLRNDDDLGYLLRVLRNTFVRPSPHVDAPPAGGADARGARADGTRRRPRDRRLRSRHARSSPTLQGYRRASAMRSWRSTWSD